MAAYSKTLLFVAIAATFNAISLDATEPESAQSVNQLIGASGGQSQGELRSLQFIFR